MRSSKCNGKLSGLSDNKIISKCTNKKYTFLKNIGSGSFGNVYKTKYIEPNGRVSYVAVKKIDIDIKNTTSNKLRSIIKDFKREVELSYKTSKMGISPFIYKSFYYIKNYIFTGIIIMDLYDKSVEDIYYEKLHTHDYIFIHSEMLKLMKLQIFNLGVFCTDIKPENFVLKNEHRKFIIRSIDYGTDWCSSRMPKEFKTREYFYTIIIIQLCLKIYIHTDKKNAKMLTPFFNDKILTKLTNKFKNFEKIKEVIYDVITSDDGEQIKYYFIEIIEEIIDINIEDDRGIIDTIIFIFNRLRQSIN